MPLAPIFSATRTRVMPLLHDVVDARGQGADVVGLDRREHRDAQLVAPELAVGLDVDDPVGAQRGGDLRGVDVVGEVDRPDDERALGRIGDERRRVGLLLGPAVQVRRRGGGAGDHAVEAAAREHPLDLVG
jgi:hypothetical protein